MYFDGLIRKFKSLENLKGDSDFISFHRLMVKRLETCDSSIISETSPFTENRLVRLFSKAQILRDGKNVILLSAEESTALENLLDKIKTLFKEPHRELLIQLLVIDPHLKVSKHTDGREFYAHAKRFNLILDIAGIEYSCFMGGDKECLIDIKTGDIFELNNRSYHAAFNNSDRPGMVLVVDFIESTSQQTHEDLKNLLNLTATNISHMTINSPEIVWGY